jgi:putative drug exporter of the RND superfamily
MQSRGKGLTGTVGRWSARHPWLAITLWIAFVVGSVVAGNQFSLVKLSASQSQAGESGKAAALLERHGLDIRATETVLVRSKTQTVDAPGFKAAVGDLVRRLDATPNVQRIESPYTSGAISADRHAALVRFEIPGEVETAGDRVAGAVRTTAAAQAAHPGFTIAEAGDATITKAVSDSTGKSTSRAESLTVPATLLILIVTFGGLLLAGVPVALALSAVVATFGLARIASHVLPMTDVTSSVVLLIGMAVGVDYSLFMIARAREERKQGKSAMEALDIATATSGRAVLVSGITVVAAMSGMFLTGNKVFGGIALGTMMVVAVAMVGSLTVLPAFLAPKGAGVLGRVPGARVVGRGARAVGRGINAVYRVATWPVRAPYGLLRRAKGEGSAWGAILDRVLARPWLSAIGATAVLVALAIPALTLSLGFAPTTYGLSKSLPVMKADTAIRQSFPGSPSPAVVTIEGRDVTSQSTKAAIDRFERAALATGQARAPFTVQVGPDGRAAQIIVPIVGTGHDAAAIHASEVLRNDVVPQTLGASAAIDHAYVTGEAAGTNDFTTLMKERGPIVIGFVLLLSFILMLVTFRSIVIPIKAIVLNLLSVAAAYGVMVTVFQHHWAQSLLGFEESGHIESWIPIFLFVILFGLSMDYHVFILSRVRELWERGMTSDEAVAAGIRSTAGVVTSAAAVMVVVFAIFATSSELGTKQIGFGLAVAILLDATIIRGVLLPATMKLLGDRNWYLPRGLRWLPTIDHGQPQISPA